MTFYDLIAVFVINLTFLIGYAIIRKEKHGEMVDRGDLVTDEEWKQEQKTRRYWLYSFFGFLFVCLTTQFFDLMKNPELGSFMDNFGVAPYAALLLFSMLVFTSPYHYCAFKKRGTRWLTMAVLLLPLSYATDIFVSTYYLHIERELVDWVFFAIAAAIKVNYWYSCLKFRKVNLLRKKLVNGKIPRAPTLNPQPTT